MLSRIWTTYYAETFSPRRVELDYCLAVNAETFDVAHVLAERVVAGPADIDLDWRMGSGRQKYADVMRWIGEVADDEDLCVIANCDITIPTSSIQQISESVGPNDALALSRYDLTTGGAIHFDVEYSQDVWAFRGKPKAIVGDYFFGVPGCDNRFAYELQQAGYLVSNPSKTIRTYHHHRSAHRTRTNSRAHRVEKPYLFVKPTEVGVTVDA